jgi:Kdo2-lipid IVA lauroyltransferase/acyltransferase
MSQKPRKPKVDLAVYLAVRFVFALLQAMPLRVALGFANTLAWLAYKIDKRHREVARENLKNAFPEWANDTKKIDGIVRDCYRHYCTMFVEIVVLPRKIHLHNWKSYCQLLNGGWCIDSFLDDRPTFIVTAHYGNWEVAGYITGLVGLKSYAIARLLDNPHLERFLKTFRQKTGQTILAKKGDFDLITEVLAQKQVVATLGDQDAGERGLYVDFFNRPASTHKAIALLAMQYDVKMIVVGTPRVATPIRYELQPEEVIDPRDYRDVPTGKAVKEITERFTNAIERLVRRHPEQYFWLHRRWKHQPKPKSKSKSQQAA